MGKLERIQVGEKTVIVEKIGNCILPLGWNGKPMKNSYRIMYKGHRVDIVKLWKHLIENKPLDVYGQVYNSCGNKNCLNLEHSYIINKTKIKIEKFVAKLPYEFCKAIKEDESLTNLEEFSANYDLPISVIKYIRDSENIHKFVPKLKDIKTRRKIFSNEEIDNIRNDNRSIKTISKEYGCSYTTIHSIIRHKGAYK
jgi:hypothetical protein